MDRATCQKCGALALLIADDAGRSYLADPGRIMVTDWGGKKRGGYELHHCRTHATVVTSEGVLVTGTRG